MAFVSGATTNPSASYTPASGTNTMLVWVTGATGVGTATVSGQDFGGTSMSEVANSDQSVDLAGSGDPTIASAFLLAPGTTSQTCSLTWSSSRLNEGGYAFTVDDAGSITGTSGGTYSGSGTTEPSLSYDAEDGDTVVYVRQHCRGGGAISWTAPTNFTERSNIALVTSPGRRSMAVWTRDVTSTLSGQTVQAGESADGNGVHHVFVIKKFSSDVTANMTLETISIDSFNMFVLASNIASLINTVDNYELVGSGVSNFGAGGSNTSDATYRDETDELITIRNGSATADVYDLGSYGTATKTITLNFDGSDCEGICDMGGGEFATCSEDGGRYQFNIYDWPSDVGTTATSKQEFTIAANAANNNSGPEGICYDRANKIFYIVGEGEETSTDREFFKVLRPGVNGRFGDTSTSYAYNDADDGDGWSLDDYISQPWDPEVEFSSYGATGATFDLSSIDFDHDSGNVLIASHTGQKVLQVDVTDGSVVAEVDNTDLTQMEGIAILPDGKLMMMGEADEYQIFESITTINMTTATMTIQGYNMTIETAVAEVMTADSGSYSTTGTDLDLRAGRKISADSGAYSTTGTNIDLVGAFKLLAEAGSYSVSGTDAALSKGSRLEAETGSYSYTGTALDLDIAAKMTLDSGSYIITGTDISLLDGESLWTDTAITEVSWADTALDGSTWTDTTSTSTTWIDL